MPWLTPGGSTWKTIGIFSATAICTNFLEGYSLSYPNTAADSFHEVQFINSSYVERNGVGLSAWAFTWFWTGLLNLWFIGFLFGTLITPYVTDNYGRKRAILCANSVSLCSTFITLSAVLLRLPELFIVARLISSSASGLSFGALIIFFQEAAPTHLRGKCGFIGELSFIAIGVVGMALAAGTNALLGQNLPALIGVGVVPGVIGILLVIPLRESPKWLLISRQDRTAAVEALVFYRGGTAAENQRMVEEMLLEARQTARIDLPVLAAIREVLRQPHLRRAMTIGIVSLQLLVGSWAIILVSTVLLEARFSAGAAQLASLSFSSANLIASVVGMGVVERFGRRPMLLGSGVANTLCLCSYLASDQLAKYVHEDFKYGCVASLILYGVTYGSALGPIALFITSELVPYHYRALIQSLVYALSTVVNFGFSFATLPLFSWIGVWAFMPLFILPSFFSLTYLWAVMPETRGKEIHEIVAQLISDTGPGVIHISTNLVGPSDEMKKGDGQQMRRKSRDETAKELCLDPATGVPGVEPGVEHAFRTRVLTAISQDGPGEEAGHIRRGSIFP